MIRCIKSWRQDLSVTTQVNSNTACTRHSIIVYCSSSALTSLAAVIAKAPERAGSAGTLALAADHFSLLYVENSIAPLQKLLLLYISTFFIFHKIVIY